MHIYFRIFCIGPFYISMKNPVDNPLLPIFRKPRILPPGIAWWSFGLKQISGSHGQNINTHPSKLQTKQTYVWNLKSFVRILSGNPALPTEHAKEHLNCYSSKMNSYSARGSAGTRLKSGKRSHLVSALEVYHKFLYFMIKNTYFDFRNPSNVLFPFIFFSYTQETTHHP